MANEFKVRKGLIVQGSGSTILDIQGSQGQLFSVTDSLSGSLFSVNDISGVPIMEVFSDNRVNLGTFNAEAIKVSGSFATMTGSLFGTASWANNATSATSATTATNANTASNITPAINGNVNNRVLTADGDGTLTGEANLLFDGTNLELYTGSLTFISQSENSITVSLVPGGGSADSDNYLDVFTGEGRVVRMGNNSFDVTGYGTGLSVTGRVNLRASALGSAATHILVFNGDPSSTTRGIYTRTPAQLRSDIGAGTVSSIATNNGVTGGTITSTGTIGLTGQALALHNLATNGLIARTGAGTVAGRTLTGTANKITVTNGDGVSGNPTISLPTTITGLSSVTSTAFVGNLTGNASSAEEADKIYQNDTGGSGEFLIPMAGQPVGNYAILYNTSNQDNVLRYNVSNATLTSKFFSGALLGNAATATSATVSTTSTNVRVTISATNSNFKIPFANTTVSTTGDYGLLQDSEAVFTYNPSTNTFTSPIINATTAYRGGDGSAGAPAFSFSGDTNTGMYNITADTLGFSTAGSERLRITAGGAMGLGGITPTNTNGRFEASNDIVAYSSSDKNWKKNIKNIDSPLEKLSQINGVEFDWIEDEPVHGNKGHDIGVIAQEIEQVLPQIVQTRESGMKAVQYDKIIPLLIESIKEQQKQIDELKQIVNGLTN